MAKRREACCARLPGPVKLMVILTTAMPRHQSTKSGFLCGDPLKWTPGWAGGREAALLSRGRCLCVTQVLPGRR